MAMKYNECFELYTHTLNTLTNSKQNYTAFLESAGNNYKYSFEEQLLIFAQYPKAKACVSFDFWSKHGSRINRNSEGIALLDESATPYKKLKYVFDVSQTTALYPEALPKRWEITDKHEAGVNEHLSNITGVAHDNIADTIVDFVRTEVENSYISFLPEILSEKDNALLSDLDDVATEKVFRELLTDSVTYAVLARCGIDPKPYFDDDSFSELKAFDTSKITDILGGAINTISGDILSEIERKVRDIDKLERRSQNERNAQNENHERSGVRTVRGGRNVLSDGEIQSEQRTPLSSGHEDIYISSEYQGRYGRRNAGVREIRPNEGEIPQRTEASPIQSDVADRQQPDRPSVRDTGTGGTTNRPVSQTNGTGGGRDGGTESERPNAVGSGNEQHSGESGGNRSENARVRITEKEDSETATKEAETSKAAVSSFEIYQLKEGEKYHSQRFANLSELEKQGIEPNISDYDMVYSGNLADIPYDNKLEGIYTVFNTNHPADYKGRSLSVGDVVITTIDGKRTANFVDSVGFKDIPYFLILKENDFQPENPTVAEFKVKPAQRYNDNINAIRTLKAIESLKDKLHDALSHLHGGIKPIEVETQIADTERQIDVPFAKADELKAKSSRLAQLNAELDVDDKKNDLGGLEQEDNPQTPKIKR